MTQRLLTTLKRSERPSVRIICFPYAGGHATFAQSWAPALPKEMALLGVTYPRDAAAGSAAPRSAQSIARSVLDEVLWQGDRPLILFGYSLGAHIAYEVSQLLVRSAHRQPAELVVAAARAPHLPSKSGRMSALPDDQFIVRLRELGGTPPEVLDNAELLEFFMPMLRADFAISEQYQPSTTAALACPITAIGGSTDATTEPADVAAWQGFTAGGFRCHQLDGHHFFLQQQPQAVLAIVREAAERHAAR